MQHQAAVGYADAIQGRRRARSHTASWPCSSFTLACAKAKRCPPQGLSPLTSTSCAFSSVHSSYELRNNAAACRHTQFSKPSPGGDNAKRQANGTAAEYSKANIQLREESEHFQGGSWSENINCESELNKPKVQVCDLKITTDNNDRLVIYPTTHAAPTAEAVLIRFTRSYPASRAVRRPLPAGLSIIGPEKARADDDYSRWSGNQSGEHRGRRDSSRPGQGSKRSKKTHTAVDARRYRFESCDQKRFAIDSAITRPAAPMANTSCNPASRDRPTAPCSV